jgi:hypothetical protein
MFYKIGEFIQVYHRDRAIRILDWINTENEDS